MQPAFHIAFEETLVFVQALNRKLTQEAACLDAVAVISTDEM